MARKLFILLVTCICFFTLNSCGTSYEAATSFLIGNSSWTPWKNRSEVFLGTDIVDPEWSSIGFRGDYDYIEIFNNKRPWITYFVFKIDYGQIYNEKSDWSQYTGSAEYYVSDSYPTIEDIFKERGTYMAFPFLSSEDGKVKRTAKAKIAINTRNNRPLTYNIYFDNVGFALCLGNMKFSNSSWLKKSESFQKKNTKKIQEDIYD